MLWNKKSKDCAAALEKVCCPLERNRFEAARILDKLHTWIVFVEL
jgi:hypothetical protein